MVGVALKWRLMLTTLPYVVGVLALKLLLELVFHFPGLIDFSDLGLVLTGSVFLMGFMLAGVMTDYKESEKLPGELACGLEAVEDHFALAAAFRPGVEMKEVQRALLQVSADLDSWLHKRTPREAIFPALESLLPLIQKLEQLGAGGPASKAWVKCTHCGGW